MRGSRSSALKRNDSKDGHKVQHTGSFSTIKTLVSVKKVRMDRAHSRNSLETMRDSASKGSRELVGGMAHLVW